MFLSLSSLPYTYPLTEIQFPLSCFIFSSRTSMPPASKIAFEFNVFQFEKKVSWFSTKVTHITVTFYLKILSHSIFKWEGSKAGASDLKTQEDL